MKNKETEVNLVVFDEPRSSVVSSATNSLGVPAKRRGSLTDAQVSNMAQMKS